MFFSAYVGDDVGLPRWRESLAQHARWLGLEARTETRRLNDCRTLGLGWLERGGGPAGPAAGRRGLIERNQQVVAGVLVFDGPTWSSDANAATLTALLARSEVRVAVPPASPQQVFYAETQHGYVFADDLRLFRHVLDVDLDDRGVYALLRYGAVPPTLTIYAQVRRIPNGHELRLLPGREPECSPVMREADPPRDGAPVPPERWLSDTLDATLARVPPSTVLYFSGGVDSSLLAARLSQLGRHDVRLVNYCFGREDTESPLAARVAAHLGLECHQVRHELREVAQVLERVDRDYSFPFGDLSTIPTNILVHGSLPLADESRTVIEGTGADGAFGFGVEYRKWQRLYAIPRPLRRWAETTYRALRLWRYDSGVERAGRLLSRSAQLSLGQAVVAQNALERVAYTTPDDIQAQLRQAIHANFEVLNTGTDPRDHLSFLDLVWVCAGRMAPKSFDPLRGRGIRPIYPFLQPAMVAGSSALSWDAKCTAGEKKALLKRLLARHIPPEWVYRPKSGFTRPAHAVFAEPTMQDYLHDVVLSPGNPLLDYCRRDTVRQLVERSRHRALGVGAYNFLWALTFTSGWLRRPPRIAARVRVATLA